MQPFSFEQLAKLKNEWAQVDTIPTSGPLIDRARGMMARLPTVALAQIVAVRVKFLQTFAFTELRKRGEVSAQEQVLHAVDVLLQKHGQTVPQLPA